MLSKDFLAPYRAKKDPFPSLLARSTYLSKYSRGGETWTDTVVRCVIGNLALDPSASPIEAERLFDVIWKGKGCPPGRGFWTGGVEGIPIDARYNCHYGTIRSLEDWCWVADMLMCGGGVGVGLRSIGELPPVADSDFSRLYVLCSRSHPNEPEVFPDDFIDRPNACKFYVVEDSRQGWIQALRMTLEAAWAGRSLVINVSPVRQRGALIKTFGGIASGPAPLVNMLREIWSIVRSAAGRRIGTLEALDITNHVGLCIKSGNVRRSALIALADPDDRAFRNAKKDEKSVRTHRHTSNNSLVFVSEEQIDAFSWEDLIEDNAKMGEPGFLNLWRIRQTDPLAEGVNPCGEIPLEDREACCLSEVYPALWEPGEDEQILRLITRYTLRQRLQPMSDRRADDVRRKNMRLGVGLGGACDFGWTPARLRRMAGVVRETADRYADELGVARPNAVTTVKPSGTISLLFGSSPGAHAPHSPFSLRRTRIAKDSPMAEALVAAGVPHEECVYDLTGNTWAFAFPEAARDPLRTKKTQTVREQIERQLALQEHWADNAVSSTISFREEEKGELASLLREHVKRLKSVSCLPEKHAYQQPPYEEIEESAYREMRARIDHDHPLVAGTDDLEIEGCEGGACPIR